MVTILKRPGQFNKLSTAKPTFRCPQCGREVAIVPMVRVGAHKNIIEARCPKCGTMNGKSVWFGYDEVIPGRG